VSFLACIPSTEELVFPEDSIIAIMVYQEMKNIINYEVGTILKDEENLLDLLYEKDFLSLNHSLQQY
jgi:hypothetical protein